MPSVDFYSACVNATSACMMFLWNSHISGPMTDRMASRDVCNDAFLHVMGKSLAGMTVKLHEDILINALTTYISVRHGTCLPFPPPIHPKTAAVLFAR